MPIPLLALGGLTVASIIGPPIVNWIGDQTWNKENAEAQRKAAEAAAFDAQQRKDAGVNPYAQGGQTTPSGTGTTPPVTQTNTTDPFSAMMPMFMMMMMLPMMQSLGSGRKKVSREEEEE